MVEFIVIHGQFHQPVIINIDAVAVARTKTESNGSKHMEIVMTSGITVTTDMTFEDLTRRLRATPVQGPPGDSLPGRIGLAIAEHPNIVVDP